MTDNISGNTDNTVTHFTPIVSSGYEENNFHSTSTICRFFLNGACRFGELCWNIHASGEEHPRVESEMGREIAAELSSNLLPGSETVLFTDDVSNKTACGPNSANWANAPEFVPRANISYAAALKIGTETPEDSQKIADIELCPYFVYTECPFEGQCPYVHGNVCELCGKACLNPFDEKQRKAHTELCEKEFEKDMERAFAAQRSRDKSCGICMDVIVEKEVISERRFGILEKCNHVFCLSCIRKWRQTSEEGAVLRRACPECCVPSNFIIPSLHWVDTEEARMKLIAEYKLSLSRKACKYFKQGSGTCPFGASCFYLHAKPDGTKVEVPPLVRRRRYNQDEEVLDAETIYLWNFLELRMDGVGDEILMQLEVVESDD